MNVQLLDHSIYRSDKGTVVTATLVCTAVAHCQMCCTCNCNAKQHNLQSPANILLIFVYHSQSIRVLGHMDANRASVGPSNRQIYNKSKKLSAKCGAQLNTLGKSALLKTEKMPLHSNITETEPEVCSVS